MTRRTRLTTVTLLILWNGLPLSLGAQRSGPPGAPGAPPLLDTIHVTSRASTLAAPTRSVEVIGREEIAHRAIRSIGELLAFAQGVDIAPRSPAQADLSIRGSTPNQVLVLIDGVRSGDVQSGHYDLDLAVPLASIERIEILRGAGSALYGSDAIGGVVNIVTRRSVSASGQLQGGSFGRVGGAISGGANLGTVATSAGAELDRSDGHRPGTAFRVAQLRASAQGATQAGLVVADVAEGVRDFGAADFYSPYASWETTRTTTATLRLVPTSSRAVVVSGAAHARRHSDVFTLQRDNPAFYQNRHLSWQSGVESSVHAAVASWLAGAMGGELFDARLHSARLGDHDERRAGMFAEATAGRPAAGTINVGIRADKITGVAAEASPFVGVALPVRSWAQVRASAGRGFRAPDWTERYYRDPSNIADSTLGVEHFWSSETGVRLAPASWFDADIAYFQRHATSLIDWARPAGSAAAVPWHTQNFADATYHGLEARVDMRDLLGVNWTLRGSGLRFASSAEPGTEGKYALRPITRTLGVQASTSAFLGGTLTANALRARRAGEDDHLQVDGRWVRPARGIWYSVELVNLAGASYLDASGKPVIGRSVFLTLGWPSRDQ